jgi:hypothetical protein
MKSNELRIEDLTCDCTICGKTTTMTGTKKCDGCWTLEMQFQMLLTKDPQKAKEWLEQSLRKVNRVL